MVETLLVRERKCQFVKVVLFCIYHLVPRFAENDMINKHFTGQIYNVQRGYKYDSLDHAIVTSSILKYTTTIYGILDMLNLIGISNMPLHVYFFDEPTCPCLLFFFHPLLLFIFCTITIRDGLGQLSAWSYSLEQHCSRQPNPSKLVAAAC